MIPTSGRPASSSSSSVSGIVVMRVRSSRCEAWIGSSPSRTPACRRPRRDGAARRWTSARASASARSPRPRSGRGRSPARTGRSGAATRTSTRSLLDVVRPFDHRVRQDRRHGRHAVRHAEAGWRGAPRSASSSPSFISQIPIPSKPAAAYARSRPRRPLPRSRSRSARASRQAGHLREHAARERRPSSVASRRDSRSPRRGPAPGACSRRCARAARPAWRGRARRGWGGRGGSGRARRSRRRCRRRPSSGSPPPCRRAT